MAEAQNAPLNGAYYGPSIPPPKSYYHPGRSRDCCCGCCLLRMLLRLVIAVVIFVGVLALAGWLVFRPNKVKFYITDARLSQFNLSANSHLHYDLSLNITIRNPNKRIKIYYDQIEARPFYGDQWLDSVFIEPFYQGKKNTTELSVRFHGQSVVPLSTSDRSEYESDTTTGFYGIDVKLYLRVRFKFLAFKLPRIKPKMHCDIRVPLSPNNGTLDGGIQNTRCDIDF